jgi:hypothetical protein
MPGSPVPARQRCSWTRPGSSRSRPAKRRLTSAWLRAVSGRRHLLGGDVAGRVREGQVAARRDGLHQPGHQGGRVVLVGDAVQDAEEHDRDRPAEVQDPGGPGQDRGEVAQVGVDVGGRALGAAGQQGPGVQEHDRVVVHVHHPGVRRHPLGHLVRVVRRGQPGPDVEELPDARLGGQVVHHAAEKRPLRADAEPYFRQRGDDLLGDHPVRREVILAAQPVVVDPRDMRHARIEGDALVLRPVRHRLALPRRHPPRISLLRGQGRWWSVADVRAYTR